VASSVRTAERPEFASDPGRELDHCVLLPICVDGVNGVPIHRYANDSALDAEFTILRGGQPESMRCCTSDSPQTLPTARRARGAPGIPPHRGRGCRRTPARGKDWPNRRQARVGRPVALSSDTVLPARTRTRPRHVPDTPPPSVLLPRRPCGTRGRECARRDARRLPVHRSGDAVTRGFYVLNFQGATIDTVMLGHAAAIAASARSRSRHVRAPFRDRSSARPP